LCTCTALWTGPTCTQRICTPACLNSGKRSADPFFDTACPVLTFTCSCLWPQARAPIPASARAQLATGAARPVHCLFAPPPARFCCDFVRACLCMAAKCKHDLSRLCVSPCLLFMAHIAHHSSHTRANWFRRMAARVVPPAFVLAPLTGSARAARLAAAAAAAVAATIAP
jgi:hypothetical protein